MTNFRTAIKQLPYIYYHGLTVEAIWHHISDSLSPEAVAELDKWR